ncbi:hypothetical protein [Ligilactobacillus pobuzihii]|nr:hypothetical protein [Ligilactobacillus pobuzihii]GEN48318.1 hypothetical protein LPO01_11100 [Ligilactobacillus pobuzihii]
MIFEYIFNSISLAIIAGVVAVIVDYLFLKGAISEIEKGEYGNYSVIIGVLSFLLTAYIAIVFGSIVLPEQGASTFMLVWSAELILITLVAYILLFFTAKREIKSRMITFEKAVPKYFDKNAILGFALGHYVPGILFLMIGGMEPIFNYLDKVIPNNPIGGVVYLALGAIYTFIIPGILLAKTQGWLITLLGYGTKS